MFLRFSNGSVDDLSLHTNYLMFGKLSRLQAEAAICSESNMRRT